METPSKGNFLRLHFPRTLSKAGNTKVEKTKPAGGLQIQTERERPRTPFTFWGVAFLLR